MGSGARTAGQRRHEASSHSTPGLDAKKQSLFAAERSETARAAWCDLIGYLPVKQRVFVEECGSHIALTPLYARAPRGQRAYGAVPRTWGKNTTLITGVSLDGIQAPLILEGAVETLAVETSVEQVLVPRLKPSHIVVLDKLRGPTGECVRQASEAKGCQVVFLPASSPDFAPSEEACSKLKTWLRLQARTREALEEALAQARSQSTAQDAYGWFWHCGYLPKKPEKGNAHAVPA